MTRISDKFSGLLKNRPFYVLLLPIFFILHGVKENFGFIALSDILSLVALYCISSLIVYFIFFLLYKNPKKAGLATIYILSFYFFYGALQDFLKTSIPQLNRYILLIPSFLVIFIILIIFLKKTKKDFSKLSLFLNAIFIIYILYDLSIILINTISPQKDKFTVYSLSGQNDYKICADCPKPDIYFLVFDEYASSVCLKNNFGYDNSHLDSFLLNKKFQIQVHSSSNYNFTPFSMASILNMSYINGINKDEISGDDYARCNKLIRENEVMKFMSYNGYDIINYSIFDLAGNPSPVNQDFLPLKARLITDRTLWGRMQRDILWNLVYGKFEIKWLVNSAIYNYLENNTRIVTLVKEESAKKNEKPRFIYAHYNMPHPPYYFDNNGKLKDQKILAIKKDNDKPAYFDNIKYTNSKIEELVNTIQQNDKNAVIMVMGDHGYRYDNDMPEYTFFKNQNAVYLPGKNYIAFYDTITGVNQFRALINTLFKQNIPVLKDSSIFLRDKQ